MSWAFALLLTMYAGVRWVLWLRGHLHYRMSLRGVERHAPLRLRATPSHLPTAVSTLFGDLERLAVRTDGYCRDLRRATFVDPDSAFGDIRHGAYRYALLETWRGLRAVQRSFAALPESTRVALDDLGVQGHRFDGLLAELKEPRRRAAQARALEPFPRAEVERVLAILRAVSLEARHDTDRLLGEHADPYRGLRRALPTTTQPACC